MPSLGPCSTETPSAPIVDDAADAITPEPCASIWTSQRVECGSPENAFQQLLQALQEEHDRSLSSLQSEIRTLKSSLGEKNSANFLQQDSLPHQQFLRDGAGGSQRYGSQSARSSYSIAEVADLMSEAEDEKGQSRHSRVSFSQRKQSIVDDKDQLDIRHGGKRLSKRVSTRSSACSTMRPSDVSGFMKLLPIWLQQKPKPTGGQKKMDKQLTQLMKAVSKKTLDDAEYSEALGSFQFGDVPANASKQSWRLPFSPGGRPRLLWDVLGFVALLYDMYTIPLQVFEIEDVAFFQIVGRGILIFWTMDMFMSFNTGFITRDGEIVTKYKDIALRYLRTWFWPDVLIVSTEWCVIFFEAYMGSVVGNTASYARMTKMMRVMRILRTLRMTRLCKIKDLMYAIQYRMDTEWMTVAWGLVVNVVVLVTLNHMTACVWFLIGKQALNGNGWVKDYGYEDKDAGAKYLVSLHWSLTLFTPASMNVHPVNDGERAYAVFNLILAMVIFTSFVSSCTAGFTRLRNLEADTTKDQFMLRKFFRENNISSDLAARIVRYIDIARNKHKRKVTLDRVMLLKWVSGPLNVELRGELCAPYLNSHIFFRQYGIASHDAMNEICVSACSTISLSKGDTLMRRFSEANQMIIVMAGSFMYRCTTKLGLCSKYVRVADRSYVCEAGLWVKWVHHGSMKAITESDYMSIDYEKMREVSVRHREIFGLCCAHAKEFHAELCSVYQLYGSAWDLPLELIEFGGYPFNGEVAASESSEQALIEWTDSELSDFDNEATSSSAVDRILDDSCEYHSEERPID